MYMCILFKTLTLHTCFLQYLPVSRAGLDSLAWSFMAAFGASVGGYANSKLGMRACFLLDSLTFFTNAIFVRSLVVPRPLPTAPTALSEGAFSDGSAPGGSRGTDAAEKGNPRPPRLLVGQEGTGREVSKEFEEKACVVYYIFLIITVLSDPCMQMKRASKTSSSTVPHLCLKTFCKKYGNSPTITPPLRARSLAPRALRSPRPL